MKAGARFTLVELLVVIGVIAVLVSMLLPALSSARDLAKRIQCQGNLKQLGICVNEYLGESNGFFPSGDPDNKVNEGQYAYSQLSLYIPGAKDTDGAYRIYYLASYPNSVATTKLALCPSSESKNPFSNYGWNSYIASPPHSTDYGKYPTVVSVARPSQIILMADARSVSLFYYDFFDIGTGLPYRLQLRHQSKANLLFVDGHVAVFGSTIGKQSMFY